MNSIKQSNLIDHTLVRLDPLMTAAEQDFKLMLPRMHWHGQVLDWERVLNLKELEHGSWLNDDCNIECGFTDYVWKPCNDEIIFMCEELPAEKDISRRGSRYFHAIYSRGIKSFIHVDGAIRIYSPAEFAERISTHVKNIGKVGKREKVFLIDGHVSVDTFASVCSSYYVWNEDVRAYFSAMECNG